MCETIEFAPEVQTNLIIVTIILVVVCLIYVIIDKMLPLKWYWRLRKLIDL